MAQTVPQYRWSREEFLRAWEAGVFEHRVELVEGDVWPVVIGDWHGETVFRLGALLPREGVEVSGSTLPSGESLPDPDCWVRRKDAAPSGKVGVKLSVWSPADVLLVAEVSDDTVMADLGPKARLYAAAGYAVYWVITGEAVYEHTEPTESGYRLRTVYRPGDRLPVRYAGTEIGVSDLVGTG